MTGDEILKPFRFPGVYKLVRLEVAVQAYEAGWLPLPAQREHDVLMVWLCQCPMKVFW